MAQDNYSGLDLLGLITSQISDDKQVVNTDDKTELKYALYLRKSTEGEDRQEYSIEDQRKGCYDNVINKFGIQISDEDIYQDSKSAKVSSNRPAFTKMIEKVKKGYYDGIIAWHHDRLARNMKEAGEIIDLIDSGDLTDLLFATANFENTPNGKMVLGINFVLSKHYSDHLSESVLRGNAGRTSKGSILNHIVHGYRLNRERRLVADGENWEIIRQAFRMRIDENRSQKQIADFINRSGYKAYRLAKGHHTYTFTNKDVSKLLGVPLYAGVHKYGGQAVRLGDHYKNFEPVISEEEYIELNGMNGLLNHSLRQRSAREGRSDVSNFLRSFVICVHCDRTMSTGIATRKRDGVVVNRAFRFRCETESCPMVNKGPAGSVIRDYVVDFLKNNNLATEETYSLYLSDMKGQIKKETELLQSQKKSLEMHRGQAKRTYENARNNAGTADPSMARHYTSEVLDELKSKLDEIDSNLSKVSATIESMDEIPMSLTEFLELYKNTGEILQLTSSMTLADEIIKIFFSNITIEATSYGKTGKQKQWSVKSHCLREPFDKLVENTDNSSWSG